MGTTRAASAAPSRGAVIIVPEGFDAMVRVAGLAALTRHCLGLSAAGVRRICVLGAKHEQLERVRAHEKLRGIDIIERAESVQGSAQVLFVSGAHTFHRAVYAWAFEQAPAAVASPGAGVRLADGAMFYADAVAFGRWCAGWSSGEAAASMPAHASGDEANLELPAPLFVANVGDEDARRRAVHLHLRSLIKPTGGMIDRHLMRPISLQMTRGLMETSVTPNVISTLTLVLGLVAAVMVASTQVAWYVGGALLHVFVRVLDCVDGELARLRYQGSAFGQWLDTVGDGVGVAALVAAVTYKVGWQNEVDPVAGPWLWIGAVGIALYVAVQVLQLQIAKRETGGGSLQAVDWAFARADAKGVDRLVGLVHNFVRIDFISTAYALLVILNANRVLLVAHLVASGAGAAYLLGQRLRVPAGELEEAA